MKQRLSSLLISFFCLSMAFSAHADTETLIDVSQHFKNQSVIELSESALNALTVSMIIVYAQQDTRMTSGMRRAIEALDDYVNRLSYPDALDKVIEATGDHSIHQKEIENKRFQLFERFEKAGHELYKINKACIGNGSIHRRIITKPIENSEKKTISFSIAYGDPLRVALGLCPETSVTLVDRIKIDHAYYVSDVTLAQHKLGSQSDSLQQKVSSSLAIDYQYEAAGLFRDSVAPAKKAGRWGLIDTKGQWLIHPQYLAMGKLSQGLMAVTTGSDENRKTTFIHKNGEPLPDLVFENATYFSEGLAAVKVKGKWGFIDDTGTMRIKPIYEGVRAFKQGFSAVKMGKKWGFINKKGQWLVKPLYAAAYSFTDDGLAVVVVNNKRGFIDKRGRFVIKPSYRRVQRFSEGLAPVSQKREAWSFVDKQNQTVFPTVFRKVRNFSEGLSAIMNSDKKWGYIDQKGQQQIPYEYDKAYDFKNGLALVKKADNRGFIDTQGHVIIPFDFDDAYQFNEHLAPVKKNGLWGYLSLPDNAKPQHNSPK